MPLSVLTNDQQPEFFPSSEDRDVITKFKGTQSQEIVIGLCGPIGAPMKKVAGRLQHILNTVYDYNACILKLSDYIKKHAQDKIPDSPFVDRYTALINEGNRLRATFGSSILAELAIADISAGRKIKEKEFSASEHANPSKTAHTRFCHIIDSIKNDEELHALRAVYGSLFICIGVYASPEVRSSNLTKGGSNPKADIDQLMDRDSGEEIKNGQTVRDTFPQSDYFIDCNEYTESEVDEKLERFLRLALGAKVVTPTIEESAMYTAFTASLNSACLSRQVGAAVTDSKGNLLGVGWNDVPCYNGGLYNTEVTTDKRCFNSHAQCSNDNGKDNLARDIAQKLIDDGILNSQHFDKAKHSIRSSRIKDLIEFSRAVHAEMLALLNAGRSGGERMIGGSIFVTTYPCHACARHIVAAGIHNIYYIEPYRKSLALSLHDDALSEAPSEGKVRLIFFEGASPTRYAEYFRIGDRPRKENGELAKANPKSVRLKASVSIRSFPALEKIVIEKLAKEGLIVG